MAFVVKGLTLAKLGQSTFAFQSCTCAIAFNSTSSFVASSLFVILSVVIRYLSVVLHSYSIILLCYFGFILFSVRSVFCCPVSSNYSMIECYFCPDTGNVFQVLQSPLQQPSGKSINITHKICPACFCLSIESKSLLRS